jgi:hypothetical protein
MTKTKPATPAYLADYGSIHNLLSQNFKPWAFEVAPTGQSVTMTHRTNVGLARKILTNAGFKDVQVTAFPLIRYGRRS